MSIRIPGTQWRRFISRLLPSTTCSPRPVGPQYPANFWGTYKFMSGKLKNFGLGIGGNKAGQYKVIHSSATGVLSLQRQAVDPPGHIR